MIPRWLLGVFTPAPRPFAVDREAMLRKLAKARHANRLNSVLVHPSATSTAIDELADVVEALVLAREP